MNDEKFTTSAFDMLTLRIPFSVGTLERVTETSEDSMNDEMTFAT